MPEPRIILRIELTPGAKANLEKLTTMMGMTQVAMLSRLVQWFATEDEMIQRAVMGQYPKAIQGGVASLIVAELKRRAKS